MIVLSRKHGETIIIDVPPSDQPQRITVTVGKRGRYGDKIRLCVDAVRSIIVMRSELVANWRKPGTGEEQDT